MQITIKGQSIAVATGGKPFDPAKPALIFIHGAGMDSTVWQLPARAFAHRGFSVAAPDLPGDGRSGGTPLDSVAAMASFVTDLMSALKIERAALAGHSMGGAIALEAAATLGTRATALALIGTAGAIPVAPALLATAKEAPDKAYKMMVQGAHSQGAKIGGSPVPGMWMSGLSLATFRSNSRDVLAIDLAACNGWTTGADAAKRIACPTTVIMASADVMTPAKKGRELASLIPNAKTITIPNAGHMLMSEAPTALLKALVAALPLPSAA
ncbi:MAG: hypothetical protein RL291_1661 [Pseudomonadota bacterium]